jgi:AmmeMemoRadiSam system protein B
MNSSGNSPDAPPSPPSDSPSDSPSSPAAAETATAETATAETAPAEAAAETAKSDGLTATLAEPAAPEPTVDDGEEASGPDPSEAYPMLRPLDAYPIDDGRGQKLLALADPSGIAPGVITLPPFGAAVIELCDGSRTRDEVCADFLARYRRPLPKESLEALLQKLDDALMLDSTRFRLHCARLYAEFAELETRPALCAGQRYPADAEALRGLIAEAFGPPNGPGFPKLAAPTEGQLPATGSGGARVLVAPTVDFTRGGPAYAWAYRALLEAPRLPSLIVLIGVDHSAHDPLLTLTRKHFATPLGTLETDVQLVETLLGDATARSEALGELLTRDESHHRSEHSLEFQAVWLSYVLDWRRQNGLDVDVPPPKILPILCGSLHELAVHPPSRDDKLEPQQTTRLFDEFAIVLQQRIGERQAAGQQTLWIGAADLAHVGPRFGDAEPLIESDRDSLERRDRETLKPVLSGDAQSFLGELRRERDRRRVVGLGTLYFLLSAACPTSGRIRCYAQCAVDAGSYISTVSLQFP